MPKLSKEQRSLILSANAHLKWAKCEDRTAATAPAREAAEKRFERQVDPEGRLDPAERARRAENARKAYFKALAAKSSIARAKRKAAAEKAARKAAKSDGEVRS